MISMLGAQYFAEGLVDRLQVRSYSLMMLEMGTDKERTAAPSHYL